MNFECDRLKFLFAYFSACSIKSDYILLPSTSLSTSNDLKNEPPLVVDLDGSLIYTDLLWESITQLLKAKPFYLFHLLFWLLQGKAVFKHQIASHTTVHPENLPYDQVLLQEVKRQHDHGRLTILATGSHHHYADLIAAHLKIFAKVIASDQSKNLISSNKANALIQLFGEKGFDYIGNARADIAIWNVSRNAYSVGLRSFQLSDGRQTQAIGSTRQNALIALIRAMRPRQWLKNLLVFIPILSAHLVSKESLLQSILAFVAFSLSASSAYLLNDALDVNDDRKHPDKCRRPLASGALTMPLAMIASMALAGLALSLSAYYQPKLMLVVMLYLFSTIIYSSYLKRLMMVDVIMLAILYSLRIWGGGVSTGINLSFWLLSFSLFIFLSLALLKRHSELLNLSRAGKDKVHGRGYTAQDKVPVGIMGINSAFVAVLILMLYFNSENVIHLYTQPEFLLGIVPLLVFWLGRLWILSFRGQVNEDPIIFVSKDKPGLAVMLCAVVFAMLASS
jgi:4-hydroxybenzoate polyprenyltransferase